MNIKVCSKCGLSLPIEKFWRDKIKKEDGRRSICKECMKLYYQDNKDRILESKRRWREKNKERQQEYSKHKYKQDPTVQRARNFLHRIQYKPNGRKYRSGYLDGDGCCLICFNINPFMLTEHHYFKDISDDTITVCGNCHRILDYYPMLQLFNL